MVLVVVSSAPEHRIILRTRVVHGVRGAVTEALGYDFSGS